MNLSGCDAVAYVKEERVNDLLRGAIACFGSHFRVSARTPLLQVGQETIVASGTLVLADVAVSCTSRSDNAIRATVIALARLSGLLSGNAFAGLALKLTIIADIPILLKFASPNDLSPVLDLSTFTLSNAHIEALDDDIPETLRSVVLSAPVADAIANELRRVGDRHLKITIPSSRLLGAYAQLIATSQVVVPFLVPVGIRVMDGCFAVAFAVLGRGSPVPNALTDLPWAEYDRAAAALNAADPTQSPRRSDRIEIAVAIDSSFLADFFAGQITLFMRLKARSASFRITGASCVIQNGRAFFDLSARQDALASTADLRLRFGALIIESGFGPRPMIRDLIVDLDLGLFDSILSGLASFFGFTAPPEQAIREQLVSPTVLTIFDLSYSGILPEMPPLDSGVPVPAEFARRGLEFTVGFAAGLFQPVTSFASGTFSVRPPQLVLTIDAANRMRVRDRFLTFVAQHPDLTRDPSLWLEWHVLDAAGATVWSTAGWADSAFGPLTLDLFANQAVQALSVILLECRVFRGRNGSLVMSAKRGVIVEDRLSRSQPYMRHSRGIAWDVRKIVDGAEVVERVSKTRRSAIHKTRFPGRCGFADAFTSEAHQVQYLTELPDSIGTHIPPEEDVGTFSRRLCPYCFR